MDERAIQSTPAERPVATATLDGSDGDGGTARSVDDPRALTILTTEHWSLPSARSLVYNEAFARGGMFLTFLSATLVALGLVSAATGFSREFLLVAGHARSDLFVGLATMGWASYAPWLPLPSAG